MRALVDSPHPHPYNSGREVHWNGWALKLMYIILPIYLFWCLDLKMILDTMGTHFVRYHFMVGPETHVHKITNITFLALGLNDFVASKSIT
jgi:hypothetical protein